MPTPLSGTVLLLEAWSALAQRPSPGPTPDLGGTVNQVA
jgi:hypothetical protein